MFSSLLVFALVTTSTTAAVVKPREDFCSPNEFACDDGACVSQDHVCDGLVHCADGSDEGSCHLSSSMIVKDGTVLHRLKRQSQCRNNQWRCRDGSCISFDGKCDGLIDCPDASDESYPLCRNNICQAVWFRCTYGACVDGDAPCNGVKDCADNSDELLPRCRNETDEVRGQFKCANGVLISAGYKCDGAKDCADGSDETVRACGTNRCPGYLFQCAYGACVDAGSDCNGKTECADGSDESDELCNRIGTGTGTGPAPTTISPTQNGACVLPPYPENGGYVVAGAPSAKPGQAFDTLFLNITCHNGYGVVGKSDLFCVTGVWSGDIPKCVRFCKLIPHPSVEYRCQIPGSQSGYRACALQEPSGTIVIPECRSPNYYSPSALPAMHCIEGSWDYTASQRCQPECGKITDEGTGLIIDGQSAKKGELPWHIGIYRKTVTPYKQICGGSLVSTTLVISAAHCFWNGKALPAENYAVGAGKIYRPWNNPRDEGAQKRDVSDIKIPSRFFGAEGNYQEDIALLIVTQAFEYKPYIRPVCMNFDVKFNREQLKDGSFGKVAGWGLTSANGEASQVLKVVQLPYVEDCIARVPISFRGYITSDKICAGYTNGTALCQGDSGGGLVFPSTERHTTRYYLRGIVSAAPRNENSCNEYALTTFTQITSHEEFIKPYYSVD